MQARSGGAIIRRGLVSYWPMSQNAGNRHPEIVGGRLGVSTAGAFVPMQRGKGWRSAGSNLAISQPPAVASPFSVVLRFRSSSSARIELFNAYELGGAYSGWGVAVGYVNGADPGRLGLYSKNNPGGGWVGSTSNTYADGVEHAIAVTYDGVTARFYRDGVADGSAASAVPPLYTGAWGVLLPSGTEQYALGLYGRALLPGEVARIARQRRRPQPNRAFIAASTPPYDVTYAAGAVGDIAGWPGVIMLGPPSQAVRS